MVLKWSWLGITYAQHVPKPWLKSYHHSLHEFQTKLISAHASVLVSKNQWKSRTFPQKIDITPKLTRIDLTCSSPRLQSTPPIMAVFFVKVLTDLKSFTTKRGDKLVRGTVAFRGEDETLAVISPAEHQRFLKRNRCLSISNCKKGTNSLTVATRSSVSILLSVYH